MERVYNNKKVVGVARREVDGEHRAGKERVGNENRRKSREWWLWEVGGGRGRKRRGRKGGRARKRGEREKGKEGRESEEKRREGEGEGREGE